MILKAHRNCRWILISSSESYQKSSKNGLDREGLLEIGWTILKSWQKVDWNLVKRFKITKIWRIISIEQWIFRKLPANSFAFGPKPKITLKNSWSKSPWEIDFFTFLTKYCLDFRLLSESIHFWKITQMSTTNFPISVGGGTIPRPPPHATVILSD